MSITAEQLRAGDSFENETFNGLDLTGADLGNKELFACTFTNVKLPQSRWQRARLEDCVFDGCDLTRIAPAQLSLRGVELVRCKMLGIDWSELAEFPVMSFLECNLSYCSFVSLSAQKISFKSCVLVEANFIDADLAKATFHACQLAGARFEKCNLERASFAGSRDLLLDPAKNRVKGARIPQESAILLAKSFGFTITNDEPG